MIEHIKAAYEGKLKAWAAVGANRPTRLVELTPLTGDITFEGHVFQLKGGHPGLPDRHYLWQAEHRAIVAGVLLFQNEHVWVADTGKPQDRAVWSELLDEMSALAPAFAVNEISACWQEIPGHTRLVTSGKRKHGEGKRGGSADVGDGA